MLILVLMFVGVLGGLGAAAVRQLPAPSMGWLASGGGLITLALIWRGVEVSDFTFTQWGSDDSTDPKDERAANILIGLGATVLIISALLLTFW